MACGWIEKHDSMPPILFDKLIEDQLPADSVLYDIIMRLQERKKAGEDLRNTKK
ncbi:hypothetical protein [Paenibacillus medicaginis]|uniref:Uncharacterized protein n=1 Tax=Paenibacillus medicaginis TaxID=1470560 RepID=A0ABV5C002_9BACL